MNAVPIKTQHARIFNENSAYRWAPVAKLSKWLGHSKGHITLKMIEEVFGSNVPLDITIHSKNTSKRLSHATKSVAHYNLFGVRKSLIMNSVRFDNMTLVFSL